MFWPLGQIIQVHPGSDGLIRVVTVKMRAGAYENLRNLKNKGCGKTTEIERPITRLVYLPLEERE